MQLRGRNARINRNVTSNKINSRGKNQRYDSNATSTKNTNMLVVILSV
jgi:hypothetical protein